MQPCAGRDRVSRLLSGTALALLLVLGSGAPAAAAVLRGDEPYGEATFREETVTLGEAPFELEGVLALPEGLAAFPAVVMVADFGPYDRDATVGPYKPFRDLARGLARRGIASLRYDKRARRHGPKMDRNAITVEEDVIADALAAARLLEETEGVSALFIVGHGLGATLAPEIASRAGATGAVLLAPFLTPLDELVLRQMEMLFDADGLLTPEEEEYLERARASVEQFREGRTDPAQAFLGPARYFVDLRRRDPLQQARAFEGPLLILHGGRDQQVPPDEMEAWRRGLASRSDVTFRFFPEVNHLFTWGEDPSPLATYLWPRSVRPEVIAGIADWILSHAPVPVPAPQPGGEEPAPDVGHPSLLVPGESPVTSGG